MCTFRRLTRRTGMSWLVDGSRLAQWAVVAAVFITAPLSAQSDSIARWPLGSRVRVWTTLDRKFIGYLREVRGDTLFLVAPGASRVQRKILADSAERLEIREGRTFSARNIGLGALGGDALAAGAVALVCGVV